MKGRITVGGWEPDFCMCWNVAILPSSGKMDVLMQEVTDSISVFPTLFRLTNSLSNLYQRIKYSPLRHDAMKYFSRKPYGKSHVIAISMVITIYLGRIK